MLKCHVTNVDKGNLILATCRESGPGGSRWQDALSCQAASARLSMDAATSCMAGSMEPTQVIARRHRGPSNVATVGFWKAEMAPRHKLGSFLHWGSHHPTMEVSGGALPYGLHRTETKSCSAHSASKPVPRPITSFRRTASQPAGRVGAKVPKLHQ